MGSGSIHCRHQGKGLSGKIPAVLQRGAFKGCPALRAGGEIDAGKFLHELLPTFRWFWHFWKNIICVCLSERSGKLQGGISVFGCQETVVPDTDKARRQDMHKKTTDKLYRRQSDLFEGAGAIIVSDSESNPARVGFNQSLVGYSHTMGVVAKIREQTLGFGEGRLDVSHPLPAAELSDQFVKNRRVV